ncbi:hypothetical protein EDD76_103217 [Kineothrix alysoides]|uniref:Uncharacterized protein n=1 Tax=Kineothrix alysoides TaxID=1469948 RepID=A0A4R1R3M4_9FIRM|nr:hypothetical protein EDD76_103217 [Kineothrix alysoides]
MTEIVDEYSYLSTLNYQTRNSYKVIKTGYEIYRALQGYPVRMIYDKYFYKSTL